MPSEQEIYQLWLEWYFKFKTENIKNQIDFNID